jgi:hypothetical protein
LQALIDLAMAQHGAGLDRGANIDFQAIGLLTLDSALLAAVIGAQNALGHLWWILIPGLLAATAAAGAVMWLPSRDDFDLGPDPADFYQRFRGLTADDALAQLLSDVLAAVANNASPLSEKTRRLRFAVFALALTFAYSSILITASRLESGNAKQAHQKPFSQGHRQLCLRPHFCVRAPK